MRLVHLRSAALLVAVCAAGALAGCGGDESQSVADKVRQEVRDRGERLREQLREERDRLRKRIEEAIGELEQAFPRGAHHEPAGAVPRQHGVEHH